MDGDVTHVACPLRAAARRLPEAPAIVDADGSLTFRDLDLRVLVSEDRIRDLGLGVGARVALHLPKGQNYFVLLLALIRAGCVAGPLSTRLPPEAVAPLLGRAACRALISDDESLLEVAGTQALRPERLLDEEAGNIARLHAREPEHLALDRPATVVFTSGSTGEPKAALHTFGNHYLSASGSNANIPLGPDDRWLHSLPLYHVGGLSIVFRCLLAGAAVVLPEPDAPLGETISQSGATHVSLVSTQLLRLLREGAELGSLRAVLLGGGPMPVSLVDEAAQRGLPVHTSYGLTEMASQVTTTPPGASRAELRTSGRPLPHREVATSREGEILVRGGTLFDGYVEGDAVDRSLDEDGWFHTGDLGELAEDGYLRVLGRKDNLFVSGGESIQPEEIEGALYGIRGVEEAVVVPVPNQEFGHRPVAFVRTAGGAVRPEDLTRALEKKLPRFKVPVAFHAWPEETVGMKVDRASFREHVLRLLRQE